MSVQDAVAAVISAFVAGGALVTVLFLLRDWNKGCTVPSKK